jgi:hypothetical protein
VVERPAHEDRRTGVVHRVHIVDLERAVHRCPVEDVPGPCPDRDPRWRARLHESVVHRQHHGELVDHDRDPADRAGTEQVEALVVRQLLEPCLCHRAAALPLALR